MTRKDVTFRLNSPRPFVSIARAAGLKKVIALVIRGNIVSYRGDTERGRDFRRFSTLRKRKKKRRRDSREMNLRESTADARARRSFYSVFN